MVKEKRKKILKNFHLQAKKITILSIIVAMVLVASAVVLGLLLRPERQIKRKIETMATDYYENYFYKNFSETVAGGSVVDAVKGYAEKGFTKVPLKQLLLFDGGKYRGLMDEMKKYCDVDATTMQIFPKEPYGNKNYKIEYNYSCNF